MRSGIYSIAVGGLLFAVFSLYREHLITRQAGPAERAVLLTGDEPHYLLTALALARGEGLNIGPAHAERAFERFQPKRIFRTDDNFAWSDYRARGFQSLLDKGTQWQDKRYSLFSPLLSLFAAPWFMTPLDPVRWYVLATQGLVLALGLAWILFRLQPDGPGAWARGLFVLLAGAGTVPVGYYVSQVFPEVLSGQLMLVGLSLLQSTRSRSAHGWGAALVSSGIWATPRVLPAVGLLWLWSLLSPRPERRLECAVVTANLALYAAFCLWLWGNPVAPQASSMLFHLWIKLGPVAVLSVLLGLGLLMAIGVWQRHRLSGKGVYVFVLAVILAFLFPPLKKCLIDLIAFFLTRQIGLLVLNPFMLAGLLAVVLWYRSDRGDAFQRWFLLFAGAVLAVAFYPDRRAGTCPAGRYQVIAALLLVYPLLLAAVRGAPATRQLWWPGAVLLGTLSLVLSFFSALKPHYWFRNYPAFFGYAPLESRYHLMPTAAEPQFLWHAGMLLLLLLGLLFAPGWLRRRLTATAPG